MATEKKNAVCVENRRATFAVQYGVRNYRVWNDRELVFWKLGNTSLSPEPQYKKMHTPSVFPKLQKYSAEHGCSGKKDMKQTYLQYRSNSE